MVDAETTKEEREVIHSYIGVVMLTGSLDRDAEYAKEVASEIYKKIGRTIPIMVTMTLMENAPMEEYMFGEDEHKELPYEGDGHDEGRD